MLVTQDEVNAYLVTVMACTDSQRQACVHQEHKLVVQNDSVNM